MSFVERHPSLRPLAYRDYRLLLAGSTLVAAVGPFHFMTQLFWATAEHPGQAVLYTSLMAASRGLGQLLFSLIGGAIADRAERRKVLLVTEAASLAANAAIAALMLTSPFGSATIAAILVFTFLAAGIMAIDSPARSASMPAIVGMEGLTAAISLNMLVSQLAMPLSLPLSGFLSSVFEPGQVYAASLIAWAGILPMIAALRYRSIGGASGQSMAANIGAGLRYTRGHTLILAILMLVAMVQLLGMPVVAPLGPVFMIDVLDFSDTQVGFMATTWGLGALAASLFIARRRDLALKGSTLCAACGLFVLAVLGFGYSRFIPLTAVSDFGMGFSFTAVMLTSSTMVQHAVADQVRGRVLGLFPFTAGLAALGVAPIGALGQAVGLVLLVPLLGWATLVACGLVIAAWPALLRTRPSPTPVVRVAEPP